MASGGFGIVQMGQAEGNAGTLWAFVAPFFQHVTWEGMSLWDLIQPAFMFMVGVSLPFSYAHREQLGHGWLRMFGHAFTRAIILVLLGVFLSSIGLDRTNWVFTNVLSQIGLGYCFVFLLWRTGAVMQISYIAAVLLGYGAMFFYHDLMDVGMSLADLGLPESGTLSGWFAPFSAHTNFAATFDRWFLNLFPRSDFWMMDAEGSHTLNFVPAVATMVMGLMAGELLRSNDDPDVKFQKLLLAGVPCLVVGVFAGVTICPIVKRIWTPSWVLFSGAFVIWTLAAFYYVIDVWGRKRWAFPLVVLGMNSILVYFMAQLASPWIIDMLKLHCGSDLFSGSYSPVIQSCSVMAVMWVICCFLYFRKIFLRI